MTNLVFPTTAYDKVDFYAKGSKASFSNVKTYRLSL